jgi:flagellar biosynthesis protein FlhG
MKVMYRQHGTQNFYLLLNMVKNEKEAKSVYKHLSDVVARFMGGISINYAGFIPWDSRLHEAVARRQPAICCYPQTSLSHSFEVLARYFLNQANVESIDGNIKFFWKKLMAGVAD